MERHTERREPWHLQILSQPPQTLHAQVPGWAHSVAFQILFCFEPLPGKLRSNAWLGPVPHPSPSPADQVESVRGRRCLACCGLARLFVVRMGPLDRWSHWTDWGGHGWWMVDVDGRGLGALDEPAWVADLARRRRTPGSGKNRKKKSRRRRKECSEVQAARERARADKRHPLSPSGRESNLTRQDRAGRAPSPPTQLRATWEEERTVGRNLKASPSAVAHCRCSVALIPPSIPPPTPPNTPTPKPSTHAPPFQSQEE